MRASPFFSVLMADSRSYDHWARRLAGRQWIVHDVFYQAPLYPYFLGVVYAIGGHHVFVVRVLQAVLGSLSSVLLALAAERFFSSPDSDVGRRVGLAAGLMLALYAPAIFFDGLIQKSTFDVFFICFALWLLSRRAWLWLGLAIGALTLTRENAIVFTVVIAVWAAVRPNAQQVETGERRKTRRARRAWRVPGWRAAATFL